MYARCASCHREGGSAFSLTTYKEARPWVVAIREEILRRTMPPWGAVKGFGDFRNDQALTPEEMELIVNWSEGGVPEGEPIDLPAEPKFQAPLVIGAVKGELVVKGTLQLTRKFTLDGILPVTIPADPNRSRVARWQHRAATVVGKLPAGIRASVPITEADGTPRAHHHSRSPYRRERSIAPAHAGDCGTYTLTTSTSPSPSPHHPRNSHARSTSSHHR